MTIPAIEDFNESIAAIKDKSGCTEIVERSRVVFRSGTDAEADATLDTVTRYRNERSERLNSYAAVAWLDEDPAFTFAARKMNEWVNRKISRSSPATVSDDLLMLRNAAAPSAKEARFERLILSLLGHSPTGHDYWYLGVLRALREYFFSNSVDRFLNDRSILQKRIAQAQEGLRALEDLMFDSVPGKFLTFDRRKFVGEELDEAIYLLKKSVSRIPQDDLTAFYPLSRNDKTARERLFVYRLSLSNRRFFGKSKPDFIAPMMDIEGIAHQLDLRNIEKMCAAFASQSRHLFAMHQQ